MMDFAVNNNILKKESVLYTFMLNAVNQLNLAHNSNSPTKPKSMRWDTLTIKLAVAFAVKCTLKGYEAVRKWLPLPSWRLVKGYCMADMNTDPVDTKISSSVGRKYKQEGMRWTYMTVSDGAEEQGNS